MGRPRIIIRPTPMVRKAAGQMRKLLGLWDNSKRDEAKTHFGNNANPRPIMKEGAPEFLTAAQGLNTRHITRRQVVLNRHFTEIISDVLANNLKEHLIRSNISITSIETKAWNKGVRVFYTSGKPFDDSVHLELNSLIPQLRSAVAERGLIGRVPMIFFVYDEAAELSRNLALALKDVKTEGLSDETRLTQNTSNKVWATKNLGTEDSTLSINYFSAPDDMNNKTLGLDYASIYNEVATKLERGRAQSSRMVPNVSLISTQPLMRESIETYEDDPVTRIARMQKFLINQKKKAEYHAKLRRKEELLSREAVRWEWPDENEEDEKCIDSP